MRRASLATQNSALRTGKRKKTTTGTKQALCQLMSARNDRQHGALQLKHVCRYHASTGTVRDGNCLHCRAKQHLLGAASNVLVLRSRKTWTVTKHHTLATHQNQRRWRRAEGMRKRKVAFPTTQRIIALKYRLQIASPTERACQNFHPSPNQPPTPCHTTVRTLHIVNHV
jgi:hypothetical protein